MAQCVYLSPLNEARTVLETRHSRLSASQRPPAPRRGRRLRERRSPLCVRRFVRRRSPPCDKSGAAGRRLHRHSGRRPLLSSPSAESSASLAALSVAGRAVGGGGGLLCRAVWRNLPGLGTTDRAGSADGQLISSCQAVGAQRAARAVLRAARPTPGRVSSARPLGDAERGAPCCDGMCRDGAQMGISLS